MTTAKEKQLEEQRRMLNGLALLGGAFGAVSDAVAEIVKREADGKGYHQLLWEDLLEALGVLERQVAAFRESAGI